MRRLGTALASILLIGATISTAIVNVPAANADWAQDKCSYAEWKDGVQPIDRLILEPLPGRLKFGSNDGPTKMTYVTSYSGAKSAEISGSVGVEVSIAKIVEVGVQLGYSLQETITVTRGSTMEVATERGQFLYAEEFIEYKLFMAYRSLVTPAGNYCQTNFTLVKVPMSRGICRYHVSTTLTAGCGDRYSRPIGRGPSTGGTTPPTPPGPQPVTDVRQVPDGTLLATSDTKRIYKMVGGAPVWQSTCDDNICQGQPRPTTQAVINAGPATPRNGATAIDQRGSIYVFVGGTPLWQDTCAAPVTCGSPVKVSDWSIDARDHMNRQPADGNLVQSKSGNVDLPVAVTVGGALIPFASPQEVIDSGYGADWAQRVTGISSNSYHTIGFDPQDGTLIQGAAGGVSTPVAMIAGNAIIPFANPQEVIDVGYGSDWASKVRGVPARVFNSRSRIPTDNTLIQGTGGGSSTPVAALVGGARINFANPQELIDTGYGTDWASKVRAIPTRAFNDIRDDVPMDGTLVQGTGGTPVAKIVGGARVNFASPQEVIDAGHGADWARHVRAIPGRVFDQISDRIGDGVLVKKPDHDGVGVMLGGGWIAFHSQAELEAAGYKDRPVHVVPGRVLDALPRTIGDGVLVKKPDHSGIGVMLGGGWIAFHSQAELEAAGYKGKPVHVIPGRVLDALPRTIGDGVLVKKPDHSGIGVMLGGGWIAFHSQAELEAAGYKGKPVHVVPGRVLDALPRTIGDGVLVKKPDHSGIGVMLGGGWIAFHSQAELEAAGYKGKPVHLVPGRVLDALPRNIGDGVRIGKAGNAAQGAVVGGAKIPFVNPQELTDAGYADKPLRMIPPRVWDALPTTIADGTRIKAPDSPTAWVMAGGRRSTSSTGSPPWLVPSRVLAAIPVA